MPTEWSPVEVLRLLEEWAVGRKWGSVELRFRDGQIRVIDLRETREPPREGIDGRGIMQSDGVSRPPGRTGGRVLHPLPPVC